MSPGSHAPIGVITEPTGDKTCMRRVRSSFRAAEKRAWVALFTTTLSSVGGYFLYMFMRGAHGWSEGMKKGVWERHGETNPPSHLAGRFSTVCCCLDMGRVEADLFMVGFHLAQHHLM
ncbi:hypothetical protein FJTKL_01082 [Diaporthe vaccinii]|uniref:Uncharacterized protein n=1 Tax=Diaporthe vaccinii TaxID=105482 RepID=A0ABR4F4Y7_9PEZI